MFTTWGELMLGRWLPFSTEEKRVLSALVQGAQLKAHRYLDGGKRHQLHWGNPESAQIITDSVVERLLRRKLICSNLKFPAATYVLTEAGRAEGLALVHWSFSPITAKV